MDSPLYSHSHRARVVDAVARARRAALAAAFARHPRYLDGPRRPFAYTAHTHRDTTPA